MQIRHVRDLLRNLKSKHTVLLSTHILHEVEQTCDRVVMINNGRIRANDTPQNLSARMRSTTLLHIELDAAGKPAPSLAALPGVRKVVEEAPLVQPWRRFTLRIEPGHDVRDAVLELAMKQNWRIREMHRQLPTLEDVFVEFAMNSGAPSDIPTHIL